MRLLPLPLLLALACATPSTRPPTTASASPKGAEPDATEQPPQHPRASVSISSSDLEQTSTLEGTVSDSAGQPLEGAVVALSPADPDWNPENGEPVRVRSGASGLFRIENVPSGEYSLSVTAPGHTALFQPGLKLSDRLLPPYPRPPPALVPVNPRLDTTGTLLRGTVRVERRGPLAQAWVWMVRANDRAGGFAHVQTDARGVFEVLLPPGEYILGTSNEAFVAVASGVDVREGAEAVTKDLVVLPPPPETPPVPEVARWLKRAAVPLSTVEAGHGFADLQPLKGWLAGAEVVALGDATYGTREFFQLKHRMLEFLVTELGFTAFALDARFAEAQAVNDYVLTGKGDPAEAVAGLGFWPWTTEEMLALVRWMRAYNANPAHPRKLTFHGVDTAFNAASARALLDYFGEVDPPFRRLLEPRFTSLLKTLGENTRLPWVETLSLARNVEDRLEQQHTDYARKSSERAWALAARHAQFLLQVARMAASPSEADSLRSKAKAENTRWILEHEGPGTKLVLWGHNARVAAHNMVANFEPVGTHLREALGSRLYIFGFAFNQGAYRARPFGVPEDDEQRSTAYTTYPALEGSLDAALAATGLERLALDLRGAPREGPVGDFLELPLMSRYGSRNAEEPFLWPTRPRLQYDGIFFIERTQPTVALPTGGQPPPAREAQGTP